MKRNKTNWILRSIGLILACCVLDLQPLWAQSLTISGKVYDEDGPMIGCSVVEKGNPSNGRATNIDGEYSIQVPANATLKFSYLGYSTKEEKVNGRAKIDVTLVEIPSSIAGSIRKGDEAYDDEDYEEAIEYYEKAIKADPRDVFSVRETISEKYNRIGADYELMGKHLKAIECYQRSIDCAPNQYLHTMR